MSIVEVHPSSPLDQFVPAWEELSRHALEPNAFFEPWAFLPAWRHLASAEERCLFIFSDAEPEKLLGFVPISPYKTFRHLPIRHFGVWRHVHCYLAAPLIRAGAQDAVLDQLFGWADEFGRGYLGFEFPYLYSDGRFATELRVYGSGAGRAMDEFQAFNRAFLVPSCSADEYLEKALKRKHRKDLEGKMDELRKNGEIELHVLAPDVSDPSFTDTFLSLEGMGWKGTRGTSLSASRIGRSFFTELMENGAAAGKLIREVMTIGGVPGCARVSLMSGSEALSFKIAYDERWSRHSPGMLLEIANLRWALSQNPPIPMDSCAAPDSEMFRRLWLDTRRIESILVSKSSGPAKAGIRSISGGMSFLRSATRLLAYPLRRS